MTKTDIVDHLTRQSGMRKREVLYIIDNFLDKILDCIKNDEKVEIRGFGTFFNTEKKARKVYSPIAKKIIDVPAKSSISFRPSRVNDRE